MKTEALVVQSCWALYDPGPHPARLLYAWSSPGKNTGVDCHSLLQGSFPTQGLNPAFPHCRPILYCLSHQGSPLSHWTTREVPGLALLICICFSPENRSCAIYSWPLNNTGLGYNPPHSQKSRWVQLTVSLLPYTLLLDSPSLRWCRPAVFSMENNPCISGPAQFTPMLFKGPLFFSCKPACNPL